MEVRSFPLEPIDNRIEVLMYGITLGIVAVLTIITVVITKWYLAKGILKPVYYLNIMTSLLHASVNWMMYVHDPEQIAILLYNFLSVYAIIMSVKGLKRLKEEELTPLGENR